MNEQNRESGNKKHVETRDLQQPIFIVGLPRSGSTLWLNVLAQNRDILRIGEMLYLTPWRKDFRYFLKKNVGNLLSHENIEKMVELIFSTQMVPGLAGSFWHNEMGKINEPNLKKVLSRKIYESDRSLESIFKIIIEEVSVYKGYRRFCIKFPVYVNYIPQLSQWYPNAKIVHIVRDPRAMAVSKTNDPGGTKIKLQEHPWMKFFYRQVMIFFVIIQYVWTSRLHLKYKRLPNYSLFRYEDLLSDPENVIKKLCDFVDIDFVPEMLAPRKGQASSITGKQEQGFSKQAASRWKAVISPFWKRLITFLTKTSMKRFEYDPDSHPVFANEE